MQAKVRKLNKYSNCITIPKNFAKAGELINYSKQEKETIDYTKIKEIIETEIEKLKSGY